MPILTGNTQARYQRPALNALIAQQHRLARNRSQPLQDRIEILQPNHAWTVVVRGTVLRGLKGDIIQGRKPRFNHGTVANVSFNRDVHGGRPFKDRHGKTYYKRTVVQWFCLKEEVIKPKSSYIIHFSETWSGQRFPYARDLNVVNKIYPNDDDNAPTLEKDGITRLVCTLKVDLEDVLHDHFENKLTREGTYYWELQYQLEMRFGEKDMEIELKVGGKSFGTVKAGFEAEQV